MAKRLPSPTDEDVNRVAEALNNLDIENKINDLNSYNESFDDYFEGEQEILTNKGFKAKVFNELQEFKPQLKEVQFREVEPVKAKPRRELKFPKKVKGRTVFTSKSSFKIFSKDVTRFRDKRGRFTNN